MRIPPSASGDATFTAAGMLDPSTRRLLLFLRYGIGDVVMELPALGALRRALPRAHVTMAGAFPALQLLEGSGLADALVDLRTWGLTHRWDCAPPQIVERFREWLLAGDYEAVLDAHHTPPCLAYEIWAMGIRSLESIEQLEAEALREGENGVTAVTRASRMGWGLPDGPQTAPSIVPSAEHRRQAEHFLTARGLSEEELVAASPVASLDLKRWPLDRLAAVLDDLMEERAASLLVFCGPQEEAGGALARLVQRPERVHLVGPLHLLTVAALLARCRMLLANDTGIMHIAAAVGTPTLGIFGPTRPATYQPPGAHVVSAEPRGLSCPYRDTGSLHPPACFAAGCCLVGATGCIESTSVPQVRQRLRELLGELGVRS